MNGLWVRTQDDRGLVLVQEFEVERSIGEEVYIYANCKVVGKYKNMERALEVMNDIEAQLIKGSSFDDMYGSRRVSKQNILRMPKE